VSSLFLFQDILSHFAEKCKGRASKLSTYKQLQTLTNNHPVPIGIEQSRKHPISPSAIGNAPPPIKKTVTVLLVTVGLSKRKITGNTIYL
jgi:hypothetical protein